MKNKAEQKNKVIKGLAITTLVGVFVLGGGTYIHNSIQAKEQAKIEAKEQEKIAEEKAKEQEKIKAEQKAKKEMALKQLEEELELIKLSNRTTDADAVLKGTENSSNPYGSDELEAQIKAEQKAKEVAEQNENNVEQTITQATEQTTQATTQAPEQTTQATEPQTEQTTQAPEQTTQATVEQTTESTTQAPKTTPSKKPVLGEKDPTVANGTVKDGMTYFEGFGWVKGTGGSEITPFGTHDELSGILIGE